MKYPELRLRRLRENPKLRNLVSETNLLLKDLVQPLFIKEGLSRPAPILSMPGQSQETPRSVIDEAARLDGLGIRSIILFGIPAKKDTTGVSAFHRAGVVQKAVTAIKKRCPNLLIITDVCLCEYMSHGHCGHVKKNSVDNDRTLVTLAKTALSHARAGADAVAPSDMMDGRVAAIRKVLDTNHFKDTPIISYAVKYASAFYAPFRDAAESAPGFGDRRGYQMNPANSTEAVREAQADIEEGADMLIVKPGLGYLDIVRRLKDRFSCPIGVYNVSGEYSMIKAAALKGWIDEKKIVHETHLAAKRAGASFIITYWAKEMARWKILERGNAR